MFKDFPILRIFLSVAILVGIVWVSIKMTKNLIANDKVNFLFVLITSSLVGVWIIDNVIAFKTQLLDPDENKFIIQFMAAVAFLVLGNNQKDKPNKDA